MLTLTFLGVGGAFAKRNHQSNALVEAWSADPSEQRDPDATLLIDFGSTGPWAMHELKDKPGFEYLSGDGRVDYSRIQNIIVTHQHADHIGGLEELAFMSKFDPTRAVVQGRYKPRIISTAEILDSLWNHSLKGSMGVARGGDASLSDYFEIVTLKTTDDGCQPFALTDRYKIDLFRADHVRIVEKYDWPTYGVEFTDTAGGATAFFSGDTRFDYDAHADRLSRAGIVFHDAQLRDRIDSVHALLSELRTMPEAIKKKTHLYHFADDWDAPDYTSVTTEFAGFAKPHERYVLFD